MPELPEVETIRRDLTKLIKNKKIIDIEVRKASMVDGPSVTFKKYLKGKSFSQISRRGKLIIFDIKNTDRFMLLHLKMTGQLIYQNKKKIVPGGHPEPVITELPNKFSHIIFTFTGGIKLFFNDIRQFGYVRLVNQKELDKKLSEFGAEPLDKKFDLEQFIEIIDHRKKSIKAVLLDQSLLAGVGNIYADEACFIAGIRPGRGADHLKASEIKKLHRAIINILKKSIKHRGTTFSDYRDSHGHAGGFVKFLNVYQREGEKCKECSNIVKKTIVAGRGTRYCPYCQK